MLGIGLLWGFWLLVTRDYIPIRYLKVGQQVEVPMGDRWIRAIIVGLGGVRVEPPYVFIRIDGSSGQASMPLASIRFPLKDRLLYSWRPKLRN